MQTGWDVIGDIHGHAARLEGLLGAMGYERHDGVWRHPERRAAFVGDFVDRGPESLRACRIVMAMTAAGSAIAVMGNHDFNAVCLATADPEAPHTFLRPHTPKNLHQAALTRTEMAAAPQEAAAVLAWLRRLPLSFEADGLRVVHAGWSRRAMALLAPLIDGGAALTDEGLVRAARPDDPVRAAREILLNGAEADLPAGVSFEDKDGHRRTRGRLAWWKADRRGLSWRDAVYADPAVLAQLPQTPAPDDLFEADGHERSPIFFGHYWMHYPLELQSPRHACVDASVAQGSRLAAYRHSGEEALSMDRFVYG